MAVRSVLTEYMEQAMAHADDAIVWGGNYFTDALPPKMGWLVWNKMQRDFSLADGELAWSSYEKAMRIAGAGLQRRQFGAPAPLPL